MTPDGEQWIGPGDTARKFGVTAKALRVYEREGLLEPSRTAAGWRVYGPEHSARLHLIVVLRDLGLPLKAVRTLLRQKTPSLVALLTMQQEALEAKRGRIDRAIGLLTAARGDLAAGRALSLDDLTHLSRETVMSEDLFDSETNSRVKTLFDEQAGAETHAALKGRVEERMKSIGKSKEDILGELRIVLAEGRTAMALGDPNAEPVKAAVRRWMSLFGGVVRKDDPMRPRLRKARTQFSGTRSSPPNCPWTSRLSVSSRLSSTGCASVANSTDHGAGKLRQKRKAPACASARPPFRRMARPPSIR